MYCWDSLLSLNRGKRLIYPENISLENYIINKKINPLVSSCVLCFAQLGHKNASTISNLHINFFPTFSSISKALYNLLCNHCKRLLKNHDTEHLSQDTSPPSKFYNTLKNPYPKSISQLPLHLWSGEDNRTVLCI